MKNYFLVFLTAIALITVPSSLANIEKSIAEGELSASEKSIAEINTRLDLLPDQEIKLSPILTEHMAAQTKVFEKYGLDKENSSISLRDLRAFRNEALALNKITRGKVSEILTDEQLNKWDALQQENRAEVRSRFSR